MQTVTSNDVIPAKPTTQLTRALLSCGVIAGPLFIVVGLIQAFTRPGFDLTRHALSLLENGDLGWIQIANFGLSGLLFAACALGMRRVLHPGRSGIWGPLLVATFGVGMFGAGIFHADPVSGFPPGTPASATAISWHGLVHLSMATIAFLAVIAVCFVFARRFAALKERGWVVYSVVTGVIFFVAFAGEASGQLWMNLAFVFTALNAFGWVSAVAAKLLSRRA